MIGGEGNEYNGKIRKGKVLKEKEGKVRNITQEWGRERNQREILLKYTDCAM